jgi:hypothetical protein
MSEARKPPPGEPLLRLASPEAEGGDAPLAEPSEAERALWARRAAELPAAERELLWNGVERGLARQERQRSARRSALGAGAAGLAAAAAAALLVLSRHAPAPPELAAAARPEVLAPAPPDAVEPADPAAAEALALAERQSREASRALEAEVTVRMAALGEAEARGLERALAPARARLESARLLAQDDVESRLRVLSNEARYLRSLSRALRSAEEAAP